MSENREIVVLEAAWRMWLEELRGPIHGRIQTIRGMCTDEVPHSVIDAKLAELNEVVHALGLAMRFPPGRPTEADLERGRELARKHGW
ncbi:MAG: hypothetical protein ACYCQK_01945 [Acidiferrobacteraceae bacterium]